MDGRREVMTVVGNNALSSIHPKLKKPVLIFGAGQVAEVFAAYLEENDYHVAAFVVDAGFVRAQLYDQAPIVSFEEVDWLYPPEQYRFTVGMSFRNLNAPRAAKFDAMRLKGYEPLTFI